MEYVDTQFRLLREDFVKPLREGLKTYLGLSVDQRRKALKNQSVRFYLNASVRGRVATLTNQVSAELISAKIIRTDRGFSSQMIYFPIMPTHNILWGVYVQALLVFV